MRLRRLGILDRLAVFVTIWGLRRIYGADCATDVREDFPDAPELYCISCDAGRLIRNMREILADDRDTRA